MPANGAWGSKSVTRDRSAQAEQEEKLREALRTYPADRRGDIKVELEEYPDLSQRAARCRVLRERRLIGTVYGKVAFTGDPLDRSRRCPAAGDGMPCSDRGRAWQALVGRKRGRSRPGQP
ncbi:hypothetical protein ACWZEH_19945 [Streptomyces sp. QTS137]